MKLLVSVLLAAKEVTATAPAGFCRPGIPCNVIEVDAEFDVNGVGRLETAHPYGNNELNLYKVRGSGFFEFSFTDFEVDKLDDGSCGDEVWIFNGETPQGPFCGFDDAFTQPDTMNYDYYYDQMLNTLPAAFDTPFYSKDEITIGLKSRKLVNNFGFVLEYRQVDCPQGYEFDGSNCEAVFEAHSLYPPDLVCMAPPCADDEMGIAKISSAQDFLSNEMKFLVTANNAFAVILDSTTILTTKRGMSPAADHCESSPEVHVGSQTVEVTSVEDSPDGKLCLIKVADMSNVETACLSDKSPGPGRSCWLGELNEAPLNIFDKNYCMDKSSQNFAGVNPGEFCAGQPDTDGDNLIDIDPGSCQHEGAPLICDDNGSPVLYGFFDRREGCNLPGEPSVFIDTAPYAPWIRSKMADPCPDPENPEFEFEPIGDSGLPSDLTCNAAQGRVSNGIEIADISESWRWLVQIQDRKEPSVVQCAGTIVSPCAILTSAKCCMRQDTNTPWPASKFKVGLGKTSKDFDASSAGLWVDVLETIVNPNYDPETGLHDLCIMKIHTYSTDVAPIASACLPGPGKNYGEPDRKSCWVAGWGNGVLRESNINVLPHDYCVSHGNQNPFKYDQVCGGKPDANGDGVIEPGPGLCHDCSGAPLICPINGEPVLFGVASQGSCDDTSKAEIFTRTDSQWNSPWIAETIGSECPAPGGECLFPTSVPVTWVGGRQTRILYESRDGILVRINLPQARFDFNIREEQYLMFALFQRYYCGRPFFDAWEDVQIYTQIMDSGDYYELQHSYVKTQDRYSSITMQIRMNEVNQKNLPTKKSGIPNPKRDQIFLFFGGLENIDWGKKDKDQCFTKLIVGAMEMPSSVGDPLGDFDYTPCVGEEKKVGFGKTT